MEADRAFKHLCKLCNRSFPCGRSLGGHMRSHLMNNQAETGQKLKKIKIQDLKRDGRNPETDKFLGGGTHDGYSLRKNPKKTCRLDEFSAATTLENRFCRECGKGFQSWKALFGHMKCHSTETERVCSNLELDNQSDDEISAANRGKRSRRQARYMASAASSSFSFANAASSSVSDQNDQEQEEIALCLMMLSRDVTGVYSTSPESSENNSLTLPKQVPSLVPKNHFFKSVCMRGKVVKLKGKKLDQLSEMNSGALKLEGSNSELFSASIDKTNQQKFQQDYKFGLSSSETEFNQPQIISSKFNTKERRFHEPYDRELKSNSSKKSTPDDLNSEAHKSREKRSKFQCSSCDRTFHSYQALGGHRASHKKTKGCLDSKIESSENSIETEISNDPTFESKPTCCEIENQEELDVGYEKKSRKLHECPICFRIFSSGQALGGHKRSHFVAGSESRNKLPQTIVIQKPEAEIRDFLDLNLPAPVEEEGNSHLASLEPWWVGSGRQHEQPLMGLI